MKTFCLTGVVAAFALAAVAADDAAKYNSTAMNERSYGANAQAADGLRVLFIGNSITLHGPYPSIGWTNNWGMAASSAEKDFVHLVTRGVEAHFGRKTSVMVRNLADFERNFRTWDMTNLNEMVAFDPQVLVVALGENTPELKTEQDRKDYYQAFRRLFGKFLDGKRTKPLAAVRGVFWPNAAKDAAMESAAGDYALPFVKADVYNEPGMDAKDAGWKHAGIAAHPGDKGMAEIARRILETLFPTESGFAAAVDGKPVKVRPIRISAMEFNRFPSELWQRPADQTEVAGMVTVEAKGATKWAVRPSRAFTNAVVRPLAARVKPVVKNGEVLFALPRPGHYTLELDGFHNPLQMFVEPKRDFAEEKKAATLYFGPGNHYAGELRLRSHDRVYIDRDAYVYGMFGIEDAEDVQISGYGVICGTVGRRCTSHCYGGMTPTPIWAMRSKKVKVYGPTVIDSACWCVSTFDCRDVELSHIKVTGAWRYNTDGVDICNSENVYLHDSFIHSFDDTVVIKGLVEDRTKPVGNIRVERCTCWCGWGGTLETGLETWASSWRNVTFEDCDLIHNSMAALRLHLGGPCKVENTTYRNIRIEYDASESEPEYHQNHDDKYTKRAKRPWNDCWLAIMNDKMYGPNSMWKNPNVSPDEPFGSFGTATFENVDITVDPGVPTPKQYIGFVKGTSLGKIVWKNVRLNGKTVEISNASAGRETRYLSAAGDDMADGLTPATAWRTVEKLNRDLPAGATAFLRCGDVFYGGVEVKGGTDAAHRTVLTSYGKGARPVVTASKTVRADPEVWENFSHCFWRVDLRNPTNFTGISSSDCNPGFLLVDGKLHGWKRFCHSDLVMPWDFCGEDGYLYVHATNNPARLAREIRVSLNVHCIHLASHMVVSNLAVKVTGAHGMYTGWRPNELYEDIRVSDCTFEQIGGSELINFSPKFRIRYGNGFELGSNCRSATVERCDFSGTYDVAVTMQGMPTLTGWDDVHIRNCTMTECTQAFEIWCRDAPKGMGYRRCSFTGNRTRRVGGGWGPVVRPAREVAVPLLLYMMDTDTVDIDVSGNVFEDCPCGLIYKSGGLDKMPKGYRVHDNVAPDLP